MSFKYHHSTVFVMPAIILLFLSFWFTDLAQALPTQSNNDALTAVPAPAKMTIDGKSDDWDLSGQMFVYPARVKREKTSVKVYAMWDKDFLYFFLSWKDSSPLINRVDADTAPDSGWMGDSFQMRFITDQTLHMTAYYSTKSDKSVVHLMDASLNPIGPAALLYKATGKKISDAAGVEQVIVEDADKQGYTQEIKIPWKMLYKDPSKIKGGTEFRFTGEYFWGGPSGTNWPAVNYADPINPEQPQRVVLYQNPNSWGKLILSEKGNLAQKALEVTDERVQGLIPIRMKVPSDAKKISVVIEDSKNVRTRNLLAHANVADYLVPGKNDEIEVMWDGRGDGVWNKDMSIFLGEVVPSGKYTARTIAHGGLGVLYNGSFYNPGLPPWDAIDDADGRSKMYGGWGFDHANPVSVGVMPASYKGNAVTFLGWPHGECGVGFIALNREHQKVWSFIRRGNGAAFIATTPKYVYFVLGEFLIARINPDKLGSQDPKDPELVPFTNGKLEIEVGAKAAHVNGMTLSEGKIVVSTDKGKVYGFDMEKGDLVFEMENMGLSRLAADGRGYIYGVTKENGLARFKPSGAVEQVKIPSKVAAVTFDSKGKMYVSDMTDKVIYVFDSGDSTDKPSQTIGVKGGHIAGPWNPQRMEEASSMSVQETADGKTSVWTVENNFSPRRISLWGTDGKLIRDFIGNTRYQASGGFMSDNAPDIGIVDKVMYKVDYKNQTYAPIEVLRGKATPDDQKNPFQMGEVIGMQSLNFANGFFFKSKASGKEVEYITENHTIFMKRNGKWQCVAALGGPALIDPLKLPTKAPTPTSVFSWSDVNMDGAVTQDEFVWHDFGQAGMLNGGWGVKPDTQALAFYESGLQFKPVKFTTDGAPLFDVSKAVKLPGEAGNAKGVMFKTKFGYTGNRPSPFDPKGNSHGVIFGLNELVGFDEKGALRWAYPNFWCAVHGGMTAPMAIPGVIMGSLKTTGITHYGKSSVISVRGNHGQEFLIRDDGIYLGELFTDCRMDPDGMPPVRDLKQVIGMPINSTSLGQECFNGWFSRQDDGKTRMTYGYTDVRIAEVTGLENIKDLPAVSIDVSDKLVADSKSFKHKIAGGDAKVDYDIASGGPIAADPKIFDSAEALKVFKGKEEVGQAVLRYDDKNLYVAWRVLDSTPFKNGGAKAETSFSTGDSVNLFIAPDKAYAAGAIDGTRVLMATLGGKPTTVVYKPTGSGKPYVFESPVRKSPFQYVAIEPTVTFTVANGTGDYMVTAVIPWSVLEIQPSKGLKLKGDIGMLFGNADGVTIGQRVQWVDKETNTVKDEPTEAEFFPAKWGTFNLK
ncbi:MAG: sugar-binding protein [Verrucomicrobiota bacterium]|nr:sugar-binding protein [Verrucomicrobiota bacterium]